MIKIGNIEIKGKVMLAPMAGITSSGYRKYMSLFGVDICVTEMVSDMGLIYGNEETKDYITFEKISCPTGVQLFGHDPESLKKAAEIALNSNPNIDFIDVNMGCPVPKVTKTGAGSSLLKNPKLCGEIIKALKEVTNKPITAKIRLGWDNEHINYLAVIKELEEAGVSLIGIHARTAKELYLGKPHYELIRDLRKIMHVPLAVSGNIYTLEDAINAINITGADLVMVARGGMGNPFLIKQIKQYYENGEILLSPSLDEQIDYCLTLADYFIQEKGEKRGMMIYRSIAPKFFMGFPNAKTLRNRLAQEMVSKNSLINIIDDFKKSQNI